MISAYAKTASQLRSSGGSGRFRRLCLVRPVAGNSIDASSSRSTSPSLGSRALHSLPGDGDCSSSNSCSNNRRYHASLKTPSMSHHHTRRSYSSSTPTQDSNSNNGKSGVDHHSFFQEQMLELEREQKRFGMSDDNDNSNNDDGDSDSDGDRNRDTSAQGSNTALSSSPSNSDSNSIDVAEQIRDWNLEQREVFGAALVDRDDGNSNGNGDPTIFSSHHDGIGDGDGNVEFELESESESEPDEREVRFGFTPEDMAAWENPNPDAGDMRKILEQVALEREKEATYAHSASLSPQQGNDGHSDSDHDFNDHHNNRTEIISEHGHGHGQDHDHHESFSHVSEDGSGVHMVDVGHKAVTPRTAHARSEVWLPQDVLDAFLPNSTSNSNSSPDELVGPKGPIFATAKIAGIMACKKTSDLIPLCHPLPLDQVKLDIRLKDDNGDGGSTSSGGGTVVIDCTCKVTHKTGVEMEALTGATVAALTIYDMTKAVSHNIRILDTRLIGKTGGKRTVLDGVETEK